MHMQRLAWIWFAGCIAWLVDGLISVRLHSWQHAELAFMVALVFLFAGFLYRNPRR